MTLHEAILRVWQAAAGRVSNRATADAINRLGLYRRRDGTPVPPRQIAARIHRYGL